MNLCKNNCAVICIQTWFVDSTGLDFGTKFIFQASNIIHTWYPAADFSQFWMRWYIRSVKLQVWRYNKLILLVGVALKQVAIWNVSCTGICANRNHTVDCNKFELLFTPLVTNSNVFRKHSPGCKEKPCVFFLYLVEVLPCLHKLFVFFVDLFTEGTQNM